MLLKNKRLVYALLFLGIFLIEVIIALFVRDNFVRPYIGDLLVTVLLCSFVRVFIPDKISALPILVFAFSVLVELAQYIDVVKIFGLESSKLLSILIGRSFSFIDILCYALGCLAFFVLDNLIKKKSYS